MPQTREEKKPRLVLEEFKVKECANDYGFSDEYFSVILSMKFHHGDSF